MKKITSLLLAVLLIFSLSISVFAEHKVYDKHGQVIDTCACTYYYIKHIGKPIITITAHKHPSRAMCKISVYRYTHFKICTECGTKVGIYSKNCTERHSICKKYLLNCLEE